MDQSGNGANASMKTLVSTHSGQNSSSGICCSKCGSEMTADPTRVGVCICPKCHTVQKTSINEIGPGITIGKYKILKKLAEGGMGVLYLCCPTDDFSCRYVLKSLRLGLGEKWDVSIRRFQREAELLSRLDHPNIVKVFDYWADESGAYYVMEYIDGDTLERIRNKNLYDFDEDAAIQIMLQLSEALDYAWEELKLLHRDIKPSNIMLDTEFHLYLLDFGLAKSTEDEATVLTVAGRGLGTPGYMSPEQFRDSRDLKVTTDIYSLGATIYFLVTGEAPFKGNTPNEVFNEMLTHDPIPLHQRDPRISENFSLLIQQTLNKNPLKRPFSWRKLMVNLERVAQGNPPLLS